MARFFSFTRLLFGWDWFIGPAEHHDRRRRTTKTLAMFTSLARQTALGNAAILLYAYVTFANAISPFMPEELSPFFPRTVDNGFALHGFKAWLQAQLCIQSLSAIHTRMLRIADADH